MRYVYKTKSTVDKSRFIAITRCCAGILGMLCCMMASVTPFAFSLHNVRILLSRSTASIDSCFITMSATAILLSAALEVPGNWELVRCTLINAVHVCGLIRTEFGGATWGTFGAIH